MRSLKLLAVGVCLLSAFAMASGNKLGIHDVSRISFPTTVRIGTDIVPAGDYLVRHTMQGEEHVMSFERVGKKDVYKVKCNLVALPHKASNDLVIYENSASKEKVVKELTFAGDSAKHVF